MARTKNAHVIPADAAVIEHCKQNEMECGPAALCMVRRWLDPAARVGLADCRKYWDPTEGMPPSKMERALRDYASGAWTSESSPRVLRDSLLLLLLASYEPLPADPRRIRNVGHWVVVSTPRWLPRATSVRRGYPAGGARRAASGQIVCVVHDPAERAPYYQAWESIRGQHIARAFRITRP